MKEKEKIQILEKIDLYIRGKLSQEQIDELWKIFLQHPEAYQWLETEVHLKSLIRKGKKPQFEPETGGPSSRSAIHTYKGWVYAAAAAVLLALGLQLFTLLQPASIPELAITSIGQSHLAGADVMRSGNETTGNIDVAINDALATAYEGEPERAIKKFREILRNNSLTEQQQALVQMNLGILLYNNGRYELAKDQFETITNMEGLEEHLLEKTWWFLGNAYLNLHQPLEAREAVFNAYSLNGRFQSAARSLLKKLDIRIGNIPADQEPARLQG